MYHGLLLLLLQLLLLPLLLQQLGDDAALLRWCTAILYSAVIVKCCTPSPHTAQAT